MLMMSVFISSSEEKKIYWVESQMSSFQTIKKYESIFILNQDKKITTFDIDDLEF